MPSVKKNPPLGRAFFGRSGKSAVGDAAIDICLIRQQLPCNGVENILKIFCCLVLYCYKAASGLPEQLAQKSKEGFFFLRFF
jgi:phage gp36-like protein